MNIVNYIIHWSILVLMLIGHQSMLAQANDGTDSPTTPSAQEKKIARDFKKKKARLYSPNDKDVTPAKNKTLQEEATRIEDEIPGTFTAHITAYKTSENKRESLNELEQAYNLQPQNADVLKELINYGELYNNANLKKEFVQKLANNQVYSVAVLDYNKNVLYSVEKNAILITNGDVDTYPIWIQQEIQKVNPTVKVWNIENLQDETYRKNQFIVAGISLLEGQKTSREIIDHILTHKNSGQVYLALTLPHDILQKYSAHLFITGLALKYSATQPNNLNILRENWENKFNLTHYLSDQAINKNYLLPLVYLYHLYQSQGEDSKADEVKKAIKKLTKAQGMPNPLSK